MAEDLRSLELRCFGTPVVLVDGAAAPADVLWRKHVALLAYLSLSPDHTRAREHLLGLLWPEKPQDKARHSLNEAIRRLRVGLGHGRLLTPGDRVTLNGDRLEVDALAFERTIEQTPTAAATLWRGEFLEGLAVDDAPPFEDWLASEQRRFRSLAVTALLAVGDAALSATRLDEVRRTADAVLAHEPTSAPAVSLCMRAAALAGDTAGALAAYREYCKRLDELAAGPPGTALQELAERIRTDEWRPPVAAEMSADPPLVGRTEQHRCVFSTLDTALGRGGQCIVLVGGQGLGKTRLTSECIARAGLQGAVTVSAHPLESDSDAPLSTVRALLAAGLRRAPGAAGIDPTSRDTLARMDDPSIVLDAMSVADALSDLIHAVADERPVLLTVDDSHLADRKSLGALAVVGERLASARVALVLTAAHSSELTPRELLGLMARVGRDVAGRVIRLDPLTVDEMAELVGVLAPWCDEPEKLDRLTRRLAYEAGGNPFYAVTLLRGLGRMPTLKEDLMAWPPAERTFEAPLPFSVPELVRMAICAVVSELDEDARSVLVSASVGGLALDLPLVRALTDLEGRRLDAALDHLEERRLLLYERDRYVFAAPLVQRFVRGECLTPGKRRRMRVAALGLLSQRRDLESQVLSAELRAKTDPGTEAVMAALETARRAAHLGAERSARRALAAAERSSAGADERARRALDEAIRGSGAG